LLKKAIFFDFEIIFLKKGSNFRLIIFLLKKIDLKYYHFSKKIFQKNIFMKNALFAKIKIFSFYCA
jgi:hypothetical protein